MLSRRAPASFVDQAQESHVPRCYRYRIELYCSLLLFDMYVGWISLEIVCFVMPVVFILLQFAEIVRTETGWMGALIVSPVAVFFVLELVYRLGLLIPTVRCATNQNQYLRAYQTFLQLQNYRTAFGSSPPQIHSQRNNLVTYTTHDEAGFSTPLKRGASAIVVRGRATSSRIRRDQRSTEKRDKQTSHTHTFAWAS